MKLFLILLPFLILVLVNASHPKPSHNYQADKCTRYCHDKKCMHFEQKRMLLQQKSKSWVLMYKIYKKNIALLHENRLGLSYYAINLLIYAIGFPLIMTVLLWGAIRKTNLRA